MHIKEWFKTEAFAQQEKRTDIRFPIVEVRCKKKKSTNRGTQGESPVKSLKTTDRSNCCIQSVHVEIKRDWMA